MIWFALIIPLIGAFILLKWFKHTLVWWEVLVPLISCIVFISIFKFTVQLSQTDDTEYFGAVVVEARYYEYWETYEHRTCTRQVYTGSDSKGNAHYRTETYDCSFCDDHPAHWVLVNSIGEEFRVSQAEYNRLMKLWNSNPEFVDMHRNIDHGGFGCGKDGDMYRIKWDKRIETAIPTTTSHTYENRIQAAHTAFDFADVSVEDKSVYKLYDYPVINGFTQNTVLGLDSIRWLPRVDKESFLMQSNYLNAILGPIKHSRIFYLIFIDQPQMASLMQEAYWSGGNDNELVVCIGLNSRNPRIEWVKPFTWSPERKIIPDIREDIMRNAKFDPSWIIQVTEKHVLAEYKRKDFKEFSYITVEPPEWAIITTWILTILITYGVGYWVVKNDIT
jgi:hypothetical protein